MAAQLTISLDNTNQILTSGVASDILDTYLNGTNNSTTRHLQIELVRNCCASGKITVTLPPRYLFSLTLLSDDTYTPGGLTDNNRVCNFKLEGIDVSYISKVEVETNEDAPTTSIFTWKEYTGPVITTGGFLIYYLENGITATHQIRVTTIDGYVYLLNVEYDWADTPPPTLTTTTTTIVSYPDMPITPVVDFIGNTITFTTDTWGLTSVTDGVFIDGIYQYNLTQVETGADVIESTNQFFNIKLRCLVTTYIASNLKDTEIGLLMNALDLSNDCNLTVALKCALYGRITRKLLMANQIKATGLLGCGCGCK